MQSQPFGFVDNYFYNSATLKSDAIDSTQRNVMNNKYSNYYVSNYYPGASSVADNHVYFATQEPATTFNGTPVLAAGLPRSLVDVDSTLTLYPTLERPIDKLSLNSRLFSTVPYMGYGRGLLNPEVELRLLAGESSLEPKSVGTIMATSFMPYREFMVDPFMQSRISNESGVGSSKLREGFDSRDMFNDPIRNNIRPAGGGNF